MSRVLVSIGAIQVAVMVVALIRGKVLAVLLGPDNYGVASTIDQTVVAIVQLGALSVPFTAMKFMAHAHGEGHVRFEQTYASFFRALLLLAAVAVIMASGVLWLRPALLGTDLAGYRSLMLVGILGVPAAMLNIFFVNTLAAAQKAESSALLNFAVLFALAVAAIAGTLADHLMGLYVATFATGLTGALVTMVYVRKAVGARATATTPGIVAMLRGNPNVATYSLFIYIAMAAYSVTMLATRYFVFDGLGAESAGFLQALMGIALTVGAIITSMNNLFFTPLVNRQMPASEKVEVANDFSRKVILLLMLASMGIALFPKLAITTLFSSEFGDAATALYLFLIWQAFYQIMNVYLQLLIGLDDVPFVAIVTCASYGLAAALVPPLISAIGLGGAGVALSAAMVVSLVAILWRLHVRFNGRIDRISLGRAALCVIAVVGAGKLFAPSTELSAAGIGQRAGLFVLVAVVAATTLTSGERQMIRDALGLVQARLGRSAKGP